MPRTHPAATVRVSALRLLALTSAGALTIGLLTSPASATEPSSAGSGTVAPSSTFPERFTVNVAGDLILTGNTLMTCPPTNSGCADSQQGTRGAKLNNNDYSMVMVDVDDDPTTMNSSSAQLRFPVGAPVLFAGLYWGAGASGNQARGTVPTGAGAIRVKVPGDADYRDLQADEVATISTTGANKTYSAYADITALVTDRGVGDYTIANVAADTGVNHFAGWSLIVVYADATEPVRAISVFDGLVSVAKGSPATIDVAGFRTPPTGPVRTALGVVAYEGDLGISGDQFTLDGRALGDSVRPTTNFFNSAITTQGGHLAAKAPNYRNQLGFDAGIVDATGRIANDATSARFQASSTGDQYYPVALTFSTELFSPRFAAVKSGIDLNGDVLRAGDEIEYTLNLRNDVTVDNGDASSETVITDVLPAGATFIPGSLTLDGASLSDTDPRVTLSNDRLIVRVGEGADATTGGTLAIGESVSIRYRMRVDTSTPHNTKLNNDFSVAGNAATSGFAVSGRSNLVSLTVISTDADLAVQKTAVSTADPAIATAGRSATYAISVRNLGPGSASAVEIVDTLPVGARLVSAEGTDWSCTAESVTLRCNRDGLAADDTAPTISVTIAVPADATAGGALRNSVVVSSDTTDPDPSNNRSSATFTVQRQADLAITKSHEGAAIVGEDMTYTLVVRNNGPSEATSVRVSDALPEDLSLTSISGDGWTCDANALCFLDQPLPAGEVAEKIVLVAELLPSANELVSNTATVGGSEPDPVPGNNTSTDTSDRAQVIDIIESLSHPGRAVAGGPPVAVTARAFNVGPATIPAGSTVTQTITLPPGTSMAEQTDPEWTCVPATAIATSSPVTVTCTTTLDAPWGADSLVQDLVLPISVAAGETEDKTVSAVISNDSGIIDVDPTNDRAVDVITVESLADLALTTTDAVELIAGGDARPVTFTVRNNGPSVDAGPITVRFSRLHDLQLEAAVGGPWVCELIDEAVQCILDGIPLAPGATAPALTLQVRAADPAAPPATFTLTGTVSSPTPDAQPQNNAATAPITVRSEAALSPVKTADPVQVRAGDTVSFTLSVTNTGPSIAREVSLFDDLGALGLTVESVTALSGGTQCAAVVDANVDCLADTLAVGETASVEVIARTNPAWTTSGRTFRNTLEVTSATPGPTPPQAFVDVTTDPFSTLTVAKSLRGVADGGAVIAGAGVVYDIVVGNSGPTNALGVTVTDTLPDLIEPAVAVGEGWDCTISGQLITCQTSAQVPVDAKLPPIAVKGTVSATAQGAIINSATATPLSPGDPATGIVEHSVREVVDLDVAHFGPTLLESGDRWRTEVSVRNNGPADEPGPIRVVINQDGGAEPIPPRVSGEGWQCEVSGERVTCVTSAGLPFGETLPSISIVSTTPSQGTQVDSQAQVTGTIEDVDRTNNHSQTTAVLQRVADLALTKRASRSIIPAGSIVTYRLTMTNNGPGSTADAQIRDVLPSGFTWLPNRSDDRCTNESDAVTCSAETVLRPGDSTTFVIRARIATSIRGAVTNTARASSSQPDNNLSNNRAKARITVVGELTPQVPLVQPPRQINPQGTTQLYPGPVPTNAGQTATVTVTCRPMMVRSARTAMVITPQGDFTDCRVIQGANGSVSIWVRGTRPVRVTVRVSAPAVAGYTALNQRYRYTVE